MIARQKPKKWSAAELAEANGVDERTLFRWFTRGCPKTTPRAVKLWRSANIKPTSSATVDAAGLGEATRRAELDKAIEDARWKRLRNDEKEGRLLDRDVVRRAITEIAVRQRTRLLSLPDRIVSIVPAELKATVKKMAYEVVRVALKEAAAAPLAGETIEDMILAEAERILVSRPN